MAFCGGGFYNLKTLLTGEAKGEKGMQTMAAKTQMTNPDSIKGAIAAKIDAASYTSWIAPLTADIVDDVLVLGAQNQFSADFINSVHFGTIAAVAAEFGLGASVVVRGAAKASVAPVANDNNTQVYAPAAVENATVAFDSFVVADENLFVVSACKKLAAGAVAFSPLFIYGPAGCGKSHLVDCIAGASNARVIKMSGAQFVSEFTRIAQIND